jgi:hypothetical protein
VIELGLLLQIFRDFDVIELCAQRLVAPDARGHTDQIDDALELILTADRKLYCDRAALEPVDDGIHGAIEIGAHAVHFIDEANARNPVFIRLAPHGFRLRLNTGYRVEYRHGSVQYAQAALDFGREIHVTRGIDDVDGAILPFAGGGGGCDGDAALLFLLHPVHDGRAFMHFADLVRLAGVIENALRGCGFAGINVRHDADIAHFLE